MIARPQLNLFETIRLYEHDLDFAPHSEPEPTDAKPGSLEKVNVMRERLLRGEHLHHENDSTSLACIELQNEMRTAVIAAALVHREECKLKREDLNTQRIAASRVAVATRLREAEIRRTKKIISTVRNLVHD